MIDLLYLLEKRAEGSPELDDRVTRRDAPQSTTSLTSGDHVLKLLSVAPRRLSDTERAVRVRRSSESMFAGARGRVERLHKSDVRLRHVQIEALAVLGTCRGLLGAIGVGHGKTLIAILGAVMVGARRPVVMVPPSLRETFAVELDKFKDAFDLPAVEVVAYSMLSRPEGTDLLRKLAPDYIFADEAHSLRHPTSARTRRLLRYLEENPETVFAAASGTLTSRSIRDYAHLSRHALGSGSPLPLLSSHLDSWANVLDVDGRPSWRDWQTIEPLLEEFGDDMRVFKRGKAKHEAARDAFRLRLRSAPGVVATDDESAACSLLLLEIDEPKIPEEVVEALASISDGISPDGETVYEDDISAWRASRQVSAGFFYRWAWEETPSGQRDEEWMRARSGWSRHVRRQLEKDAREGYDSPALVARRVQAEIDGDPRLVKSSAIHRALDAWRRVSDRPAPPTVPVWLSPYLVDAVLTWVEAIGEPVLIWYESKALGERIAEAGGWPLCGPGNPPKAPARTCVVSINAHNKGLNLQAWRSSLVVEPPSSGQTWEQLIGRTHRAGQTADEVEVFVFVGPEPFARAFASAKDQAVYQSATTGGRFKLVFAPTIRFKG